MKKFIATLLVLATVISLAACGGSTKNTTTSASPESSNTAAMTEASAPATLTPTAGGILEIGGSAILPTDVTWFKVRGIMEVAFAGLWGYETLMRYSATGTPECFLLDSITPDAGALTWTMKVKDGITFSDGSKLTAEVVAWNLNYYKENGILASSFFSNFVNAEATDSKTVVCHFSSWEILFDYYLCRTVLIASKEAFDKGGADGLVANPIGTGPFVLKNMTPDVDMTMDKNPSYWQGQVLLDGVHYTYYADELVAMEALKAGEITAAMSDSYSSIDSLMKETISLTKTQTALPSYAYTMCFKSNDQNDPCSNLDVRKAISYAIDTQALVDTLTYGYGVKTTQWCMSNNEYYSPDVTGQPYNLETAKKLLADAGYTDGFSTKLWYLNIPQMSDTAAAVAEMLSKIGITADLNPIDAASYVNYIGGWDSGILIHTMGMEGGAASQYATTFVNDISFGLGMNAFAIPDSLDALVKQAKSAASSDEAVKLFKKVAYDVFEDQCLVKVLYCTTSYSFVSDKVHDADYCTVQNRRCDLWKAWVG
ncbi:extracellular solute-binding protein, family 5 Middle [Sporobacter termitidis DSM 10068]|uniref:Extracellular solute-binding protein, family 5 Middle n=1 Tax=Sporobacter termitidis DSM 10068 TaxID=1123282 RepID=A0A1M5YRE5_9FIRM|nr:ABC transporter substrate-binding protein [Sporobacter termitidis]SHI14531.1 extracellular solute-binding protein, family 5 Middle [Sporobacter termitidis DSM 10068]